MAKNTLDNLNGMTPIEQIGAFIPPRRQGYPDNRRELRMRKEMGKTLYRRRHRLAEVLSEPGDRRERMMTSLVSAGIAPHSVPRWTDYVDLIVTREGGWATWQDRLARDVSAYRRARDAAARVWVTVIALTLMVFLSSGPRAELGAWGEIITVTLLAGCVALGAIWAGPYSRELVRARNELMGDYRRKVDDYVWSEDV